MNRLRLQFLAFFILLAGALAFLLTYAYNQINKEENRLWQGIAENVYNQMQAKISEFLLEEDRRSFSHYRYFYIPGAQVAQTPALNVSPLSKLPRNDPRGLVGYFQIDPDGTFHTPYLPSNPDRPTIDNLMERKLLESKLKQIVKNLEKDENLSQSRKGVDKKTRPKISSGYRRRGDRSSIYPNPLVQKKRHKQMPASVPDTSADGGVQDGEADELEQEVTSNIVQYQTFLEQKAALDTAAKGLAGGEDLPAKPPSIFTDPFRARLIDWKNIVFYRKVWADQKMYIQGFVIRLADFYDWLMGLSFENSQLPQFSLSLIKWEDRTLARSGNGELNGTATHTLFQRNLGYPLNRFTWKVAYKRLPHTTSRTVLNILTALLAVIATGGLYLIYRSTATQVALSQKRQDFVSAVTHELKTPLTSIRMYSEMLRDDWVRDEAKKKEYYDSMTKEGDRLSRLIDNVLQLAQLEKKNYRYNIITASPDKDFWAISRELGSLVEQQGFAWKATAGKDVPEISYDPEALKQILITLIDNSLKFSSEADNKVIEMGLKQEGDHVVWSIADRGPGVPPKELAKIFRKFYRLENEITRRTKGTGIGLAMAKMLAAGMGAQIEAKNRKGGGIKICLIFNKEKGALSKTASPNRNTNS